MTVPAPIESPLAANARSLTPTDAVRLEDRTDLVRCTVTGKGTSALLEGRGLALPPLLSALEADGLLLVRTAPEEVLLLATGSAGEGVIHELLALGADALPATLLVLPLQHGTLCLELTGAKAPDLLARLCELDLRPRSAPPGSVRITFVAHLATTVIVREQGWLLLVDRAAGAWFHEVLHEVATTLG